MKNKFPLPYYAAIFSSTRTTVDEGYDEWNEKLFSLLKDQKGFLDFESFRNANGVGVTISYWKDLDSISQWRAHKLHEKAQQLGKEKWYHHYRIRICKVEKDYEFP